MKNGEGWQKKSGEFLKKKKFVLADGQLIPVPAGAPVSWPFPQPIGVKEMKAAPLSESITISRHLKAKNINTYLSQNSIEDINREHTPEPQPVDKKNRLSQQFCLEVVATKGN